MHEQANHYFGLIGDETDKIPIWRIGRLWELAVSLPSQMIPLPDLATYFMPGVNGIETTRRIHDPSPHIGVLVLTMLEDDDSVFAAMRGSSYHSGKIVR